MLTVGSDRAGGRERCQPVAKAQKAHVLLATDVRWSEGVGVATQSDGKVIRYYLKVKRCTLRWHKYL